MCEVYTALIEVRGQYMGNTHAHIYIYIMHSYIEYDVFVSVRMTVCDFWWCVFMIVIVCFLVHCVCVCICCCVYVYCLCLFV